jgi:hypothetical protein
VVFTDSWLAHNTNVDACDLGDITVFSLDSAGGGLECGTQCVDWPFLSATTGSNGVTTFPGPTFGGHGTLAFQYELTCDNTCTVKTGYYGLACVEARSTDFDATGNTDQTDKLAIGKAIADATPASPAPSYYDLNGDGKVDLSDYNIVVNEMIFEANNPVTLYTCNLSCSPSCPGQPVAVNNNFLPDNNPPGATTLSVTGSGPTVTLSWVAPGDDTYPGTGQQVGAAQAYDIRASASPILSDADFNAATPLAGAPTPGLAGTSQSMTADGCAYKHFAMKTIDHFNKVSARSNDAAVPDLIAPAAVSDLGSSCVSTTALLLSLTSPGDDGTATAYDVRYSQSAITAANFGSATQVSGLPAPAAAGTYQEIVVTGLTRCRTYCFAMKTRDAFCNWSDLSNVYSTRMLCSGTGTCGGASPVQIANSNVGIGLARPFPNPASGFTRLTFGFSPAHVGMPYTLAAYDLNGRLVRTIASGVAVAGGLAADWDLHSDSNGAVRPGMYFVRLNVGSDRYTRQVMVAR